MMIDEKDLDLYTQMATRLGRVEAKIEVIEKQNEKIEKLVESNYALSNSIQLLTDQVATYDKKADRLMEEFNSSKSQVYNRIDKDEEILDNVMDEVGALGKVAEDYKTNVAKYEKLQQETEQKGYNNFKSFLNKLSDKTQTALIAAMVAAMGYVGLHVLEYVVKLLSEK